MVTPNRFYTYAYLREDGTPYYIGKGTGHRIKSKQRNINSPKDKSRIIFLKQNLTEEEAFKHEIYMIAVFGRKDLGIGILHNKSDGGEGGSGLIHSQETRAKISASKKGENHPNYGKTHSPETRAKISAANAGENNPSYGKTPSPKTRAKQSAAKKGKIFSPEHRAKMSAAHKGENNHMYGKTPSPETRAKQSAVKKGKTFSPEHRAKMSAAQKGENHPMYGKISITNEIVNLMILKTDIIPEGFRKGRKQKI